MRASVRFALAIALGRRRSRRLLPLARRRARIVGRLGWQAQSRFKSGDARQQRLTLLGQRGYRFRLRQDQTDQRFLVERIKPFTSHPELESAPDSPVKFQKNLAKNCSQKSA